MKTRVENNNLESFVALRERERESISLFNVEFANSTTDIFRKINKVEPKRDIMLFSNVLFFRIRKKIPKVTYC